MSKNDQRNKAEINLGNQTYDRGVADGIAGRDKNIKKTHKHAHRYHIGYRHGLAERNRAGTIAQAAVRNAEGVVITTYGEASLQLTPRRAGFLTRIWNWIKT